MFFVKFSNNVYICLVLLLFSFEHYYAAHSSGVSKQGNQAGRIDYCKKTEFRCGNERCISRKFVCDGISDCSDGSDETHDQCRNKTCDRKHFQCDYGACIDREYQCDGLRQCNDGSDEGAQACSTNNSTIQNESKRSKRQTGSSCAFPDWSPDRTINIINCAEEISTSTSCGPNEGYVTESTSVQIECEEDYYSDGKNTVSVCRGNKWRPPLKNCLKKCAPLNPKNIHMECFRDGKEISCNQGFLLSGTIVRASCYDFYRCDRKSYSEVITCETNGNWNDTLMSCIPDCGKITSHAKPLISNGTEESLSDSPWHVAVYDRNKHLICGGTIITLDLVLTAAHCFEVNNVLNKNVADYEIVASKVSRNYSTSDNRDQKSFKIKDIRFSKYTGRNRYFANDIAVVILEERLTLSPTILPACVDWAGSHSITTLADYSSAKVSGWGLLSPQGTFSENLMSVNLPVISRDQCIKITPRDFHAYITIDKFCAGSENGPGVLQGDSGGGLLVKEGDYYYLRGIVSVKEKNRNTSIALFTDINMHRSWVIRIRDELETSRDKTTPSPQRIQPTTKTPSPPITRTAQPITTTPFTRTSTTETVFRDSPNENSCSCVLYSRCPIEATPNGGQTATVCGYEGNNIKICCNLPNNIVKETRPSPRPAMNIPKPQVSATMNSVQNTHRTSAEIASQYCEKYSNYTPSNCLQDEPQIGKRRKAQQRELPHVALIGTHSESERNTFIIRCEGSLISESFILSKADCGQGRGITQRAALGITNKNSIMQNYPNNMHVIVNSYSHPDHGSGHHNNIGLYKLKTPIQMSSSMSFRPACIYTSDLSLTNHQLRIAGWGNNNIGGSMSRDLQTATITVLDDQPCSNIVGYSSNSAACVGRSSDGEALCLYTGSDPIQFRNEHNSCMWTIYAIGNAFLSLPQSCEYVGNAEPYTYTKVSYHLDWIQSIVWPDG